MQCDEWFEDEDRTTQLIADNPDPSYQRASKRAKQLRDFYKSLIAYISVNTVLFVINLLVSPGDWWFLWVVGIWGFFLILEALTVFEYTIFPSGLFGHEWEEKKTKKLMEKGE
jgi:hypothetical protein